MTAKATPLHYHLNNGGYRAECARCRIEGAGVKLLEACKLARDELMGFSEFADESIINTLKDAIKQAEGK